MTIIAYSDGVLAYDSQATRGDTIVNVPFDKKIEANGYNFFFSGSSISFDTLIDLFFTGEKTTKITSTAAFVVTPDNKVLLASFDDDGTVVSDDVGDGEIYAIGSGSHFAIGAMDCGSTASEAVEFAIARDPYSGGKVHTFVVGGEEVEG